MGFFNYFGANEKIFNGFLDMNLFNNEYLHLYVCIHNVYDTRKNFMRGFSRTDHGAMMRPPTAAFLFHLRDEAANRPT